MTAYYNEIDPHAAQWLRNLIAAGHIASGDVDERDIRDVRPSEIRGYTQCHFFAGIGIWSYALRNAGWADHRPVWTGSCPCQPFSAAGRGDGVDDVRHLWPHWHHLVAECRPVSVFGEQVASKDGLGWLDLVSSDMEATDYALGAIDTCAAGFGAPHIRQRLYFAANDQRPTATRVADIRGFRRRSWRDGNNGKHDRPELEPASENGCLGDTSAIGQHERARLCDEGTGCRRSEPANSSGTDRMGNPDGPRGPVRVSEKMGRQERLSKEPDDRSYRQSGPDTRGPQPCSLADTNGGHTSPEWEQRSGKHRQRAQNAGASDGFAGPMPTNGRWADADWLFCRDGRWRPVEPSTFPLVNGATARMGRLRAYGNGLCVAQAEEFVSAYLERDAVDLLAIPAGNLFEWGA